MRQPTIMLTQEQIDFFHQAGHLSLPAITDSDEIAAVRAIYDRLFATRAGREEGNQFDLAGTDEDEQTAVLPQILRPQKYAPELEATLFRANAHAIARQLLGPGAECTGEHAILKPPGIGAATPWHQDEAYWDPAQEYNSLSIWIPLQEATVENGCMQFMPGSHKLGVLPHHSIDHDPRIQGLEVEDLDTSQAVACPIPAGGATVHHCRTLHYAGPNRTDEPRRAYILVYSVPPRQLETPRDFYWQRMWQTARQRRKKAAEESS